MGTSALGTSCRAVALVHVLGERHGEEQREARQQDARCVREAVKVVFEVVASKGQRVGLLAMKARGAHIKVAIGDDVGIVHKEVVCGDVIPRLDGHATDTAGGEDGWAVGHVDVAAAIGVLPHALPMMWKQSVQRGMEKVVSRYDGMQYSPARQLLWLAQPL